MISKCAACTSPTGRGYPEQSSITSYAEVVLAPADADALHPAFSNLFVQTEILPDAAPFSARAGRARIDEPVPWMFHLMAVHGADATEISYETDRMRFIGREGSVALPQAMHRCGRAVGHAKVRSSIQWWRSATA